MSEKLPSELWDEIVRQLRPYTAAEGEVETIRFGIDDRQGNLKARVSDPHPSVDYSQYEGYDETDPSQMSELHEKIKEEGGYPENEKQRLEGEPRKWLKTYIYNRLTDTVEYTDADTSLQFENGVIKSDGTVTLIFRVARTVLLENLDRPLFTELQSALRKESSLGEDEEISYGVMESYGDKIDGTVFKLVENPHDYWAGYDSIEEWNEELARDEEHKERLAERDKYHIHFHPTIFDATGEEELAQWMDHAEELLNDGIHGSEEAFAGEAAFDDTMLIINGSLRL